VLGDEGPVDPAQVEAAAALLHRHLAEEVLPQDWVQAVEHDPNISRWYVRFGCEGRDAATIYLDLHQRSLHYEVYFLPDPPANHEQLYRFLLRANHDLYSARFSIGDDGDVYITGRVLLEHLDAAELDRVIGVLYAVTERWFQPAVRLAFPKAGHFDTA
jgi:hypothetical protein